MAATTLASAIRKRACARTHAPMAPRVTTAMLAPSTTAANRACVSARQKTARKRMVATTSALAIRQLDAAPTSDPTARLAPTVTYVHLATNASTVLASALRRIVPPPVEVATTLGTAIRAPGNVRISV